MNPFALLIGAAAVVGVLLLTSRQNSAVVLQVRPIPNSPNEEAQRIIIETAQRQLSTLGYYTGPFNGILDERTRAAFYQFVARNNLASDDESEVILTAVDNAYRRARGMPELPR